jgi:hypothetical protein
MVVSNKRAAHGGGYTYGDGGYVTALKVDVIRTVVMSVGRVVRRTGRFRGRYLRANGVSATVTGEEEHRKSSACRFVVVGFVHRPVVLSRRRPDSMMIRQRFRGMICGSGQKNCGKRQIFCGARQETCGFWQKTCTKKMAIFLYQHSQKKANFLGAMGKSSVPVGKSPNLPSGTEKLPTPTEKLTIAPRGPGK